MECEARSPRLFRRSRPLQLRLCPSVNQPCDLLSVHVCSRVTAAREHSRIHVVAHPDDPAVPDPQNLDIRELIRLSRGHDLSIEIELRDDHFRIDGFVHHDGAVPLDPASSASRGVAGRGEKITNRLSAIQAPRNTRWSKRQLEYAVRREHVGKVVEVVHFDMLVRLLPYLARARGGTSGIDSHAAM